MMCEEKRQTKHSTRKASGCCGPEMAQTVEAIFKSMGSEDKDDTGSCADRMAEMMKDCCGSFTGKDKPAREDESAID